MRCGGIIAAAWLPARVWGDSPSMADLQDLGELREKGAATGLREARAATRLGRRVEKMIARLEKDLGQSAKTMEKSMRERAEAIGNLIDENGDGKISAHELMHAIKGLKNAPDDQTV